MDRKKLFGMTYTEFMLIRTVQKGIRAVRETFIDIKQYTEPQSVHDRRKSRYKNKAKVLEDYEKLK
ncbi:hypothetical protein ES703_09900 [subsurface metagenome]